MSSFSKALSMAILAVMVSKLLASTRLKPGRETRSSSTNCFKLALNPKASYFAASVHSPGLVRFEALSEGEHPRQTPPSSLSQNCTTPARR
ncbi:hypothetical protein M758_1G259000 [Ceratodon purpureus]|uniref:Secreted protein n=1 Tax=Ceratodon purpureus TaxID=3225 RepID=A0A8T0JCN7_CERPU|nr:hypothetical protein KC19_1G265600 [Ceratodon purpureus]KAG0631504.1 hypothetical protein M758_1G259000 [Ceratodon purpureus]